MRERFPLRLLSVVAVGAWLAFGVTPSPAALGDPCLSSGSCGDGDLCNGYERCVGGVCAPGPALTCDDGDPCTRDFCEAAVGCVHAEELCGADCSGAPDGQRCADGSSCTRGDACAGGVCVPGPSLACDDGDACTSEQCDPLYGCVYREEAVAFPCVPSCNGAVADYTPCPGDDNVCTLDACLPSVDLIGDPHMCIIGLRGLERPCLDADVCNGDEICSPTLGCQPGPPLQCDDGELCNGTEGCDPTSGCQPGTPAADGTACDDHRGCTVGDACAAGGCAGTPLTPADCTDGDGTTSDACVEAFGCVHCRLQARLRVGFRTSANGRRRAAARGVLDGVTLAGFDAASEPLAVVIEAGGTEIYRGLVSSGLTSNAAATRLSYRDLKGLHGSLRSLALQRRADGVRWKLRAEGADVGAPSAPITVRLLAGDECFASTATCTGPSTNLACR